jgi:hypothetical protein
VTSLHVKSVIATPLDGAQVLLGKPLTIRGVAWSGDSGPVTVVDVSVDSGRTWKPAALNRDQRTQFGWRQWELSFTPPQEAYLTILARARDAAGNAQPLDQEWNPSGYLWNVAPRVGVNVLRELAGTAQAAQPSGSNAAHPATTAYSRAVGPGAHQDDGLGREGARRGSRRAAGLFVDQFRAAGARSVKRKAPL